MSKNDTPELALLIPQEGEKKWGEKRLVNKCDMVSLVTGYRHRMNNGRDSLYINKYLERVSVSGLNKLRFLQDHDFLPLGAPLLDFFIEELKSIDGWKYLRIEELELYQEHRRLSFEMLNQIEVREIVCGVTPSISIHAWITEMYKLDQCTFGSRIVSMDVEDVKTTYYDTLRMVGELQLPNNHQVLRSHPETTQLYKLRKQRKRIICWLQLRN